MALVVQFGIVQGTSVRERHAVRTEVTPSAGTMLVGIPERFDSEGAGLSLQRGETLALTLGQALSQYFALELDLGVPPIARVQGRGRVEVPTRLGPQFAIDLEAPGFQPLGRARQWSPALQLQLRPFGQGCSQLCPYLGAGATYTWFTGEKLDADFEDRLNAEYGAGLALLAGRPGPTSVRARARNAIAPVFAAGIDHRFDAHWGVTAAVGYSPFVTTLAVTIRAADGTRLSRTTDRARVDVLIPALLLSYRF